MWTMSNERKVELEKQRLYSDGVAALNTIASFE